MIEPMRYVQCPSCGARVAWVAANRFRPFCSERCKLVDLGAWATERYRVAGPSPEPGDDDADGAPDER